MGTLDCPMSLKLESSNNKTHRRKGRGIGCSKGKTCGRGHKGQRARSGGKFALFEGGQTPIYRRLPKRGFRHKRKSLVKAINLRDLNVRLKPNEHYSVKTLRSMLRIKPNWSFKLLSGQFNVPGVTLCCERASVNAKALVQSNAGSIKLPQMSLKNQLTFSIRTENAKHKL
ncbi:MAG: 50S ribosomal protein L15 [Candidatus Hodgkinia cicadicola]